MDADLFEPAPDAARRASGSAVARPPWLRFASRAGTLKARLVAGALVAVVAGIALAIVWTSRLAGEAALAHAVRDDESETRRTVDATERRLQSMQQALSLAAEEFDPRTLRDPQALAALMARQRLLAAQFSHVFVADREGGMLWWADLGGGRRPAARIGDRPYFVRTIESREPQISEPVPGRVTGEPTILFTQPLVDGTGVYGILCGGLRLASRDLLTELAGVGADDSGAVVVLADAAGRLIAHPERARLLAPLQSDRRFADAKAQWEAAGRPLRLLHQRGPDRPIVAMGTVSGVGWQVWRLASAPAIAEPLRPDRLRTEAGALALALALAAALAWYFGRQLAPLSRLERRAAALLAGDRSGADEDWPAGDDEIGSLARTLRHLWAERSQLESFNAQVLQKFSSVMEAAPVGIAFTRHDRFELVSAECCRLLGHEERSIVGAATKTVFASCEDFLALGPLVGAAFARGEVYTGEWQLVRADGSVFWARLRARPVAPGDRSAGTIWSIYDISDQVQARRQLEHAALHDALTGVWNRKAFEQTIAAAFANRASESPAALVMVDLDRFKPINDDAGHAAGDAMLQAVAQSIGAHVRSTDVVARLGGDEFAVLLGGCDLARALAVAEKVRRGIAELVLSWGGRTLRVGASLGVAQLGPQHESVGAWLAEADAACYEAKRAGRDAVRSLSVARLRVVE